MEDNRKPARRPRSAAASGPAPNKAAAGKTTTRKARGRNTPRATAAPSPAEREQLIRTAAYFRAERRGFAPGYEWEDWLAAEAEVSSLSGRQPARKPRKAPADKPKAR